MNETINACIDRVRDVLNWKFSKSVGRHRGRYDDSHTQRETRRARVFKTSSFFHFIPRLRDLDSSIRITDPPSLIICD